MRRLAILIGWCCTSCAHEPPPPASLPVAARPAPVSTPKPAFTPVAASEKRETVNADTPRATSGGATLTVPGGWSVTTAAAKLVLGTPEPDSRIVLVDVGLAKDASAAVAVAWNAHGGAKHKLKIAMPRPGRDGWDEQRVYAYETSPNEKLVIYAVALRNSTRWTVMIVEASLATYERRLAAVRLVHDSLRPKGYRRESFAGRKAHPLDAKRVALIKDFLSEAMQKLAVPGVGLGLIDGGKVVFEGGLGVRALGKPAPVTADTLFLAASNTKALTTLLLAKLVDQKKLDWDQPVHEVYPGFKLGDAETTRRVLVKHLVCACTGLPRQDLEWVFEFKKATPKSEMALLGTMQPTTRFGETFQYSNVLAGAGGFVAARVLHPGRELGAAYDEAMRKHVFDPLRMKTTTFDFARAQRGNHARPHGEDIDGVMRSGKMDLNYAVIPVRPAGGAWTSARELLRYVQMELARGKLPSGARYISETALLKRREKQVALGENAIYGMGLMVDRTWGISVVHHGGDLFGYHSDMIWLPDHGVGAVILTNGDSGHLMRGALMRRLLEVLFDGKPEAAEDVTAAAGRRKAAIAKERERLMVPPDPAVVAKLAASYQSPTLGTVAVKKRGAKVLLDTGELESEFATRKNDDGTVSLVTTEPGAMGFELVVGERDGKRALVVRDAQHVYVLTARD
jgi:CubicO group peptidase (beta-lactamase class C family)